MKPEIARSFGLGRAEGETWYFYAAIPEQRINAT